MPTPPSPSCVRSSRSPGRARGRRRSSRRPPARIAFWTLAAGSREALLDAIDRHQEHLRTSEHAVEERRLLAERQVVALARAALHREALVAATANGALAALVEDVAIRTRDPRRAAEALLVALREAWTQAGKTRG